MKEWENLWRNYYNVITNSKPQTTVLRDFHIDNLFFLKDRVGKQQIGLIDFQDAVTGHASYDLVSLIQDVRIEIPLNEQRMLLNYYMLINNISNKEFEDVYFIFGTQRLLKIVGIFYRLNYREKKENYMKFIPYTFKLLKQNLKNSIMTDARDLLEHMDPYDA